MAENSWIMTTYYAKRIVGDMSANTAEYALLQTGAGIATHTWILHRDNRASTYGIKYFYDTSTRTENQNGELVTIDNEHDKIEFYGGQQENNIDVPSAWIQLDTGDGCFLGNVGIGDEPDENYQLYVNGTSYFSNNMKIEGTSGGPYLTVNYGSRYDSDASLDNYGINLIKFGKSALDCYLGTGLNTNYHLTGKQSYVMHVGSSYSFSWVTTGWTEVMNLDNTTRTLSIRGTGNYGGYLNLIGKFNTANLKSKDTDRPGITISGYYPQICMIAGGVSNASHGATLVWAGYDGATATSGAFKGFAMGTPGDGVTWIDLGYNASQDNPHAFGINDYGTNSKRIMRWNSDGSVIMKHGYLWIQGGSNAGGNANRLTTTSGMPGNMQYNVSRRGTQIYSNGIAFCDPYNGNSNSDAGWIRHIETTSNTGYLEIGVGDDGNEEIIVRQYNTSNNVARQMYLLNSAGFTTVSNQSTDSSYAHAAMQIREANYAGASSDTWGVAPRLAWHWSGRVAAQIGLASNGYLYTAPLTGTTFYKLVYESGTWGISISGNAATATTATKLGTDAGTVNTPVYFSGGKPVATNAKLGAISANGYWGMRGADNTDNWIRTTTAGIIPVQGGGKGSGHSGLGTSTWYFSYAYIDTITSNKTYGAVWNDIAECRQTVNKEPGRVMVENKSGIMELSSVRLQPTGRVISDTYGYCMGEPANDGTPIAIAGRVLVYPYCNPEKYKLGDCVCAAPNGTVDIMTREEIKEYPDRIIGIVSEIPTYEIWSGGAQNGNDDIKVNGRIWIYVK